MSKKKQQISTSLLFNYFVGEYVQIITDIIVKEQVQKEDEMIIRESPHVFSGYLLDADDDYYFIGEKPMIITQAVPISAVKHMEIIELIDEKTQILMEKLIPDNEDEVN